MSQYIMTYFGGNHPKTPKEGQKHFAKYQEWLASLGEAVISPMNPFQNTVTVNPDGSTAAGSKTMNTGYTVLQAGSIDAAVELTKSCPFLDIGGTLEVSELVQM